MVAKRMKRSKEENLFPESAGAGSAGVELSAPLRTAPVKAAHVEPPEIISALNDAVSGINGVFQMRDALMAELFECKVELGIAGEVRLEQARIEALKREQENFQYDFNLRKARLEQDLERLEEERREKIQGMEEEARTRLKADADDHAARLKAQAAEQALKLKTEREDHERRIKLEREDFERERALFDQERKAFESRLESFEAERSAMRDRLVAELNRDNEHQLKINALNHQREVEILKSQLKLEQANGGKFETLLSDSRTQNDRLAEQLSTLSREALASASSSAMAVKLKEIISQFNPGGSPSR